MAKKTFTKQYLTETLGLPYNNDGIVLADELIDSDRWSLRHSLVFKDLDGKIYQTTYSVGATELQPERPWEHDGEIEATEVEAREVVRTEFVDIDMPRFQRETDPRILEVMHDTASFMGNLLADDYSSEANSLYNTLTALLEEIDVTREPAEAETGVTDIQAPESGTDSEAEPLVVGEENIPDNGTPQETSPGNVIHRAGPDLAVTDTNDYARFCRKLENKLGESLEESDYYMPENGALGVPDTAGVLFISNAGYNVGYEIGWLYQNFKQNRESGMEKPFKSLMKNILDNRQQVLQESAERVPVSQESVPPARQINADDFLRFRNRLQAEIDEIFYEGREYVIERGAPETNPKLTMHYTDGTDRQYLLTDLYSRYQRERSLGEIVDDIEEAFDEHNTGVEYEGEEEEYEA